MPLFFILSISGPDNLFWKSRKRFQPQATQQNTQLSKYVWSFKDAEITYNIKWSIVEKFHGKTKIDRGPLCLAEKFRLNRIL